MRAKCYGVPGLRLGILASGDTNCIAFLKKDVGIWNINSFGEFYLQIAEKYKKQYGEALDAFKAERRRFAEKLSECPFLTVFPSQANYFMAEVKGITAKELTERLLNEYHIFIKDLSAKVHSDKQYVRIAIRNAEDNNRLLTVLSDMRIIALKKM